MSGSGSISASAKGHYLLSQRDRFLKGAKLALLRQCLQELRTKHQEWNVPSDAWPETKGRWSERPQLPWDARQRRDLRRGDLAVPSRSS
jgi:hypothetical protein